MSHYHTLRPRVLEPPARGPAAHSGGCRPARGASLVCRGTTNQVCTLPAGRKGSHLSASGHLTTCHLSAAGQLVGSLLAAAVARLHSGSSLPAEGLWAAAALLEAAGRLGAAVDSPASNTGQPGTRHAALQVQVGLCTDSGAGDSLAPCQLGTHHAASAGASLACALSAGQVCPQCIRAQVLLPHFHS